MRARTLLFAALVAAGAGTAGAQVPGECTLGRAEADIDVGDVLARVFNTGSLFFGNGSQAMYLVPQDQGKSAIFAAGLWVGGLVEDELRVAGAWYADFEFWPGPVDRATGRPPDPTDCSAYDRIWRVSRHDVAEYYRTGVPAVDLAEWPFQLGAPVLDGDGDPANYDLAAGDQPAISGDQMVWWVMNDVGNVHANSKTPPMGLEVQASVFGFGGGPHALRHATFYRFLLINRSPSVLDDAYVAFWSDPDLGDASDDYTGADTLRDMAYWYNADNQDGTTFGYGAAPPAVGVQLLQGPVGQPNGRDDDDDGTVDESDERLRMTSAIVGASDFPSVGPWDGRGMYQRMQGRWNDGTPVTMREFGYGGGGPLTTYVYPGDPVTPRFWSQPCWNPSGACAPAPIGDQHAQLASGPWRLGPGEAHDVLFAIPYGRGSSNLDSVSELRRAATLLRSVYEEDLLDAQRVPGWPGPPAPPAAVELRRPAPNPFTDEAVMSVTLPAAAGVRVALVDVLGREVAVLADGPHEAGRHPIAIAGAGLAPGVYVARVWVNGQPAGALPVTRR